MGAQCHIGYSVRVLALAVARSWSICMEAVGAETTTSVRSLAETFLEPISGRWKKAKNRQPVFVLAPQTEDNWDNERLDLVFELIQRLSRELPIDTNRLYLAGPSMGGKGVWDLIAMHPNSFAAAIIVCGHGDPKLANVTHSTPLWIFHGTVDQSVSVTTARLTVAELRDRGAKPRYTEYPGVGHNAWEWAFLEPSLTSWLFARSLDVRRMTPH